MRVFLSCLLILFLATSSWSAGSGAATNSSSGLTLMDAVQITLTRQPDIQLAEQQVAGSTAALTETKGRFDLLINSSVNYQESYQPLSREQEETTGKSTNELGVGELTLELNQELYNGIRLQPSISLTRTDNQTFNLDTQNQASINFNLIVPLQKGRGRDVALAGIHSAQASLKSTRYQLQHTTTQILKEMVLAYWNYVSAKKKLAIMEKIVSRAKRRVDGMEELVRGGEKPATDLGPLRASLAEKQFSLIQTRQALVNARNSLKMAMGLQAAEPIPLPLDHFPEAIDNQVLQKTDWNSLKKLACKMRRDLKVEFSKQQAIHFSLVSTENNLKPQLDLVFSCGYNGLAEGDSWQNTFHSFNSHVDGVNYGVALHFQHPLQNRSARGRLDQLRATLQQTRIATSDLERRIISQVEVAAAALRNSLLNLRYSYESVKVYRKVVADETEKVSLGMSTVIDLISMTDKLENALLSEIETQRAYADALVSLRYETGTLVYWDGNQSVLNREQLTTIPRLDINTGEK